MLLNLEVFNCVMFYQGPGPFGKKILTSSKVVQPALGQALASEFPRSALIHLYHYLRLVSMPRWASDAIIYWLWGSDLLRLILTAKLHLLGFSFAAFRKMRARIARSCLVSVILSGESWELAYCSLGWYVYLAKIARDRSESLPRNSETFAFWLAFAKLSLFRLHFCVHSSATVLKLLLSTLRL